MPRSFTSFLLVIACLCTPLAAAEFVHPGVTHSKESIAFVRAKIEAGEEPWAAAWEKLKESRYVDLDWRPQPFPNVERGPSNDPNIGSSDFSSDAQAAYHHALFWNLTGNEAHAKKAAEIIDAWSATLESIGNHDARLLIGMSGYHFCIGAELLKHTWDGWPADKQAQFATMLREVWYPVIVNFYPSANGNWDASMLQVMIAMGVFLDDRAMFDRAKDYYLSGKGNGAIGMYFMENGQCQETGRDQAHTQMGLEFLANTCETAWVQGVDLYGALDNRLLAGFEYTAKYNLGNDVPYAPYRSFEGRYHYKNISDNSRGRLRPMYERVFNHYHNRKGLEAPFTKEAAIKLRSGGGDRDRGRGRDGRRGRRGSRGSHLDTLMYAGQPASFEAKAKVVCFGDSITKRGYYKILGEQLGVDAINAGVGGNSTAQALRRMDKDVFTQKPDVVVVFFGTNDLRIDAEKVYVPVPKYEGNLRTMVAKCRDQGAKVVICTLPPIEHDAFFTRHERGLFDAAGGLGKMISSYRDAARQVAEAEKVALVDLNQLLSSEPTWLSKDGVHPSEHGTAIIAKHIAEAVASVLPGS